MDTLEEYFGTRISAFLDDTGLSPTRFGRMALGDPDLMRQIKRGRSLRLRTAECVLAFISGFGRESGGARRPPTRPRYRKHASRAKKTKRNRAKSEQQTKPGTTPLIRVVTTAGGDGPHWPVADHDLCDGGCGAVPQADPAWRVGRGLDRVGTGRVDSRPDRETAVR